ncbi:Outer membrane lipoprotein carrier protein LolA [Roseateles sp. YR242]|uniref:LolA family protein n=1 Tax=Roseateles sp. YR242 TaxID=1855305 RepID=UPI0008BF8819|nr:outer membrane lipoprotein carrier protein LolA [Roseateles sp. YR242]SEL71286.1 Outer membrane lipoprotein carrier protein LolA [Roseateles sp. YR242]
MKRRTFLIQGLAAGPACGLSLLAANIAQAVPDLGQAVHQRLKQPQWLRGDFTQTKKVPGFTKPLVSRGEFVLARGLGVLWRTIKPFASELRLTRDEIRATQGGQTAMRLEAAREPAVRVINTLMFSLLNGDVSGLADLFDLSGEVKGDKWQLALLPKPGPLRQVLKQVALEGDSFVRRIQLFEANGDESLIQLDNLRPDAVPEPGLFQ